MLLKHGTYSFQANSVVCRTQTVRQLNTAGMPMTLVTTMSVMGDLLAASGTPTPQNDLSVLQAALEAALAVPYQDLVLYQDDGVTETPTALKNAGSLSGVRITSGPNFQGGKGEGEYAVRRQFSFEASVETVAPRRVTELMSFQESISFGGGLPERRMARAINRPPIDQVTWPFTEFTATQSGSAVGLLTWPFGGPKNMPPLRFAAVTLREAPKIDASGPDRVGPSGWRNYSVRWTANFASASPLIAAPTLWNF